MNPIKSQSAAVAGSDDNERLRTLLDNLEGTSDRDFLGVSRQPKPMEDLDKLIPRVKSELGIASACQRAEGSESCDIGFREWPLPDHLCRLAPRCDAAPLLRSPIGWPQWRTAPCHVHEYRSRTR